MKRIIGIVAVCALATLAGCTLPWMSEDIDNNNENASNQEVESILLWSDKEMGVEVFQRENDVYIVKEGQENYLGIDRIGEYVVNSLAVSDKNFLHLKSINNGNETEFIYSINDDELQRVAFLGQVREAYGQSFDGEPGELQVIAFDVENDILYATPAGDSGVKLPLIMHKRGSDEAKNIPIEGKEAGDKFTFHFDREEVVLVFNDRLVRLDRDGNAIGQVIGIEANLGMGIVKNQKLFYKNAGTLFMKNYISSDQKELISAEAVESFDVSGDIVTVTVVEGGVSNVYEIDSNSLERNKIN